MWIEDFDNQKLVEKMLGKVIELAQRLSQWLGRRPVLMEVCGTHTVAISRSGLRGLLGDVLELRSGPGCPVCVTSGEDLDRVLALASLPNVMLATFGDMLRVPGSRSSLEKERARGARVQVIYSPVEALALAEARPDLQVILIGVGFETTAPLVTLSIAEAKQRKIRNFSVLSLHKVIPPALHLLMADQAMVLDGILLPGHVCSITGRRKFEFLARDYGMPAAVTGFDVLDILGAVYSLLKMTAKKAPQVINCYSRVVQEQGNKKAQEVMCNYFTINKALWRGLGLIPNSGLHLRKHYREYDAMMKFPVTVPPIALQTGCCCGDILKGKLTPPQCPLFAVVCSPANPMGPCMVSTEGACAAYYQYEGKNNDRR